jgi:hypothetical protein
VRPTRFGRARRRRPRSEGRPRCRRYPRGRLNRRRRRRRRRRHLKMCSGLRCRRCYRTGRHRRPCRHCGRTRGRRCRHCRRPPWPARARDSTPQPWQPTRPRSSRPRRRQAPCSTAAGTWCRALLQTAPRMISSSYAPTRRHALPGEQRRGRLQDASQPASSTRYRSQADHLLPRAGPIPHVNPAGTPSPPTRHARRFPHPCVP